MVVHLVSVAVLITQGLPQVMAGAGHGLSHLSAATEWQPSSGGCGRWAGGNRGDREKTAKEKLASSFQWSIYSQLASDIFPGVTPGGCFDQ